MIERGETLWGLLEGYDVTIPDIQRDYVQGRRTKQVGTARDILLDDLAHSVCSGTTLNLNFVYGEIRGNDNGKPMLLPLDGQQRLTTLFLLHWYAAVLAEDTPETLRAAMRDRLSRFSYETRATSRAFFERISSPKYVDTLRDEMCGQRPSEVIPDKGWFRSEWLLDPTITSTLKVLDLIHERFGSVDNLGGVLTSSDCPVHFEWLDIKNIGNGDDLYIKMNARGRGLSEFENFKAELEGQFPASADPVFKDEFFYKLDQEWLDFFWKMGPAEQRLEYGTRFMNLLHALLFNRWVVENREALASVQKWTGTIEQFRGRREGRLLSDYSEPFSRGSSDERAPVGFDLAWMHKLAGLLDSMAQEKAPDSVVSLMERVALDTRVPSLRDFFMVQVAFEYLGRQPSGYSQQEWLRWYRTLRNIADHANRYQGYNRVYQYRNTLVALETLAEDPTAIEEMLAAEEVPFSGFQEESIVEEQLKARLRSEDSEWAMLLDEAEDRLPYFMGKMNFLLTFAGAIEDKAITPTAFDSGVKAKFTEYVGQIHTIFGASGVQVDPYLLRAALLTKADYSLPAKRLRTYLVDEDRDRDWRIAARPRGESESFRRALKGVLDDLLDLGLDPEEGLRTIVSTAQWDGNREDLWAKYLIEDPSRFEDLENASSLLHFAPHRPWKSPDMGEADSNVTRVLVPKGRNSQLNGFNTELFLEFLAHDLREEGFGFQPEPTKGTAAEPRLGVRAGTRDLAVTTPQNLTLGHFQVEEILSDGGSSEQEADLVFSGAWEETLEYLRGLVSAPTPLER